MLGDLFLGINSIFPVFFVIAIGAYIRNKDWITSDFRRAATTIVFNYALPCMLFVDLYSSKSDSDLNLKYMAYVVGATLFIFLFSWAVAVLFIKDKSKISAFVHCTFRSNFVYVGYPIIRSILNTLALQAILIINLSVLVLYNILAVYILSYYDPQGRKISKKETAKQIITNPMIVSSLLGYFFNVIGIPIYGGLLEGMELLGKLCSPTALLLIGMSIKLEKMDKDYILGFISSGLKVILTPLIFLPLGVWLGFDSADLVVAFVLFATPCATNTYIMTEKMGGDSEIVSKTIICSLIWGVFVFPIGIAFMHSFGII